MYRLLTRKYRETTRTCRTGGTGTELLLDNIKKQLELAEHEAQVQIYYYTLKKKQLELAE